MSTPTYQIEEIALKAARELGLSIYAAVDHMQDKGQASVEIGSRQKGPPAVNVKVYHQDPATALEIALKLYADAREKSAALEESDDDD